MKSKNLFLQSLLLLGFSGLVFSSCGIERQNLSDISENSNQTSPEQTTGETTSGDTSSQTSSGENPSGSTSGGQVPGDNNPSGGNQGGGETPSGSGDSTPSGGGDTTPPSGGGDTTPPSGGGDTDPPSGGGSTQTDDNSVDDLASNYLLFPTINGGTREEKIAILEVINNRPICTRQGAVYTEIFPSPDSYVTLKEDDGDIVKLVTSYTYNDKVVNLQWRAESVQEYFGSFIETDYNVKYLEPDYKGYEYGKLHGDGMLVWFLMSIYCGEASAEYVDIEYRAKVHNEDYYHQDCRIEDIYRFNDEIKEVNFADHLYRFPSTFDLVDYDLKEGQGDYNPYFKTNNPEAQGKQQYWYVNVTGKCIYICPNGNFILLADGSNVLKVYAGVATALTPTNFPHLDLGKVVKVSGIVSQYVGGIQLTFPSRIVDGDIADIENPDLIYRELTEEKIASLTKEGFVSQSQAVMVDGVHMNGSLRSITGTLVPNSLKNVQQTLESPDFWTTCSPSDLNRNKRFVFDLQVGSETFTIQYDYHVCKEDPELFNELVAKLSQYEPFTVKGTCTYLGSDINPFYQENSHGRWSIVPFKPSHVF